MRLDDLAARFGRPVAGGTAVRLALTQEDLAALCGTSRESANRAIRSLVRQGRIETTWKGEVPGSAGPPLGRAPAVIGVQPSLSAWVAAGPSPSCSSVKLQVLQ